MWERELGEYRSHLESRGLARETVRHRGNKARKMLAFFEASGVKALQEVRRDHVDAWLEREGRILTSPYGMRDRPERPDAPTRPPEVFTPEEAVKLLEVVDPRTTLGFTRPCGSGAPVLHGHAQRGAGRTRTWRTSPSSVRRWRS